MADKEMLIMDKNFLKALDASYFSGIEVEDIPYRELLQDSLYYPSSGHDGGAVKYMNMKYPELGINSFVYCDYAFGHEAFTREMNDFKGYQVVGSVSRQMDSVEEMMELCPDWKPVVPPGLSRASYMSWASAWKPFIGWSVYERVEPFGPDHGPERFSLLYIGGEGVATYECLYWRFNVVPKVLCLVQDGGGFGLNYTSFDRPAGPMHWTLAHHPAHQMPQYVLTGGIMSTSLAWKGYRKVGHIDHYYYHNYGVAELFETELQKNSVADVTKPVSSRIRRVQSQNLRVMNHRISEINPKVVFVAGDVFSRRLYQQLDLDAACPFCRDGGFNGTAHGLYSRSHEGMNFLPYVYDAKPRVCDVDQLVAAHLDRVTAAGNRRIAICPLFVSGLPGREADAVLMKAVYKWLEEGGAAKVDRLFVVDFCRYCNLVDRNL